MERINAINKQGTWTAAAYPKFEGKTFAELRRIAGGRRAHPKRKEALRTQKKNFQKMFPAQVRVKGQKKIVTEADVMALPKEFSWTDVNGQNLVAPVRNQGQCGSCYAFSTSDMFASRVRVMTNGTQQPLYSPQDIVDCSAYSQGCDGGEYSFIVSDISE